MSQQPKVKGVVDIVFLIDISGSMTPCIDALKANIQAFVTSLTAKDANGTQLVQNWRASAMGYRDIRTDALNWFEANTFVDSIEGLRSQLSGLRASGGGDEPESLLDALYKVADLPSTEKGHHGLDDHWRYRSDAMRAIVIFSDASFPRELVEPAGATIEDVMTKLEETKTVVTMFAPKLACYEELCIVNKSRHHEVTGGATPQESLVLFTNDPAKFQETLMQLGKTLSATVAATPL